MSLTRSLAFACLFVAPWTITAQDKKDDAVKMELKKLQGVWQLTKWIEPSEKPVPADEVKAVSFEFKEDRIIKWTDGKAREPLKVILNPEKKPKWIEFDLGNATDVKTQGIYKIDGDEMTICIITDSQSNQPPERPTEFKANEKKFHTLIVMKKVKKS